METSESVVYASQRNFDAICQQFPEHPISTIRQYVDSVAFYTGGQLSLSARNLRRSTTFQQYSDLFSELSAKDISPVLYVYWICFESDMSAAHLTRHAMITSWKTVRKFQAWQKSWEQPYMTKLSRQKDQPIVNSADPAVLQLERWCVTNRKEEDFVEDVIRTASCQLMALPELREILPNASSWLSSNGLKWIQ